MPVTSVLADALQDRYVLERELGRGGMATVYLAHDLKHDRLVALKVLAPELAATVGPERFLREIRLAAKLQHPHILPVFDSGEASGLLWYTMPYVEGESLRDRLRREGQLGLFEALQLTREVAEALGYAHDQGIVHRDIKPENILLSRGHALVADFGIAKAVTEDEVTITGTGMAVGTPSYMSPEQSTGNHQIDGRSDLYSLGCVLYELLAGEPPFTGPTVQVIITKRLLEPVPDVRRLRANTPDTVSEAIRRALAPVPGDRFSNAEEFARLLSEASTTGHAPTLETKATLLSRSGSRSRVTRWMVAGLVVLLVAGGAGWWATHQKLSGAERGTERLAVLPFENLGDSANAYFADGVTDAVRDKLATLPGLEVIASTSSGQYRRTTKSPRQIGRELGVRYLLLGKIHWAPGQDGTRRVQVRPELVEAATAAERWGEPFDAALTDVFQVQAEIATRVAGALHVALGNPQQQALAERPTRNLAAYDDYLRAGTLMDRAWDEGDTRLARQAITYLRHAVALDSGFVVAWTRLANIHAALTFYEQTPTDTTDARRALEHAVALAPNHPDVLLARGRFEENVRRDRVAAKREYEEALRATPGSAGVFSALASVDIDLGQLDEALGYAGRAQELDPRSQEAWGTLAIVLHLLRRYPAAVKAYERVRALNPAHLGAVESETMAMLAQGDSASAHATIAAMLAHADTTTLVNLYANAFDLAWALDSAQQAIVLRQPWEVFGDHPAFRLIIQAQIYHLWRDDVRKRIYADSARQAFDAVLRAKPYLTKADHYALRGLALAYLGEKAAATRDGERGVGRAQEVGSLWDAGYIRGVLARIYVAVGEPDKAIDQIEILLTTPTYFGAGWFRIDPNFTTLRGNPRFERLVAAR